MDWGSVGGANKGKTEGRVMELGMLLEPGQD